MSERVPWAIRVGGSFMCNNRYRSLRVPFRWIRGHSFAVVMGSNSFLAGTLGWYVGQEPKDYLSGIFEEALGAVLITVAAKHFTFEGSPETGDEENPPTLPPSPSGEE